jgi:hypothetical protein
LPVEWIDDFKNASFYLCHEPGHVKRRDVGPS